VALEWPNYGRRRITEGLNNLGWQEGSERVQKLKREDKLV